MRTPTSPGIALVLACSLVAACGVPHIGGYEPKKRTYEDPVNFEASGDKPKNGSLFTASAVGTYLFADQRAMRLGDIVTVRIQEHADAKRGATTELSRDGSAGLTLSAFFGLVDALGIPAELVAGQLATGFKGSGLSTRTEKFEAIVPVIVKRVLPNGNLFVEGHRVILVNEEEHHFYLSGVVRPVDINDDNSVPSYLLADAEIEFTGRGTISEKQSPGWISRGLDYVRPF